MEVLNKQVEAAAELERNPVSKHQVRPEYGDEQADAGRDCRIHLAIPISQARTRTGKYSFPLIFIPFVQLTTSRIGSHTWLIHTLAICVIIYTQNQLFDIRASYVSYSFGMVS